MCNCNFFLLMVLLMIIGVIGLVVVVDVLILIGVLVCVMLDINGDGFIDCIEVVKVLCFVVKFDILDVNKDGKFLCEELLCWYGKWYGCGLGGCGDMLVRLDINKDGCISCEEVKVDLCLVVCFDQMDVNKDGYLDKVDCELCMKQYCDVWFVVVDINKDGQISKVEFDVVKGLFGGLCGDVLLVLKVC